MNHSNAPAITIRTIFRFALFVGLTLSSIPSPQAAQNDQKAAAASSPPALKRTTTRQETRRLAYGGRLSLYGAPQGSITIEAWPKSEIEIVAEIELNADSEEDLARLASVNGFLLDEDVNHIRILATGTHDRKFMKRAAPKFPKKLLALPWKIDYRVRVPQMADLDIYAGRGSVTVKGVEGAISLHAGESDPTTLALAGGDVSAIIQQGAVNLDIPARSWRGHGINLRLLRGDLNVTLPANFNAYVNAEVLRAGRVESTHPDLAPVERTRPTERTLSARLGAGGATLTFTVGDGTIRIRQAAAGR